LLKGTGAYAEGYDGKVYKGADGAFVSLEMGDVNGLKVKVETGIPGEEVTDNRDKVVGDYPVIVDVSAFPMQLAANLELAKEGDADLKASATIEVPEMGTMNIELILSKMGEYADEAGEAVTGYYFMVTEQELDIMGTPMAMLGTGSFPSGFDGKVYVSATESFISLELKDVDTGKVIVKVESGTVAPPADNRANVAGTYPVAIGIDVMGLDLPTTLTLAVEGDADLKASATVDIPNVGALAFDMVLSEMQEFTDAGGAAVTGYMFKIAEQTIDFTGAPLKFHGTGASEGGFDGMVYKNATDAFISFEMTNDMMVVKVETAE
jgi:hypothetical protein